MPGASRSIVINASMEKVFDTITSYETYPEFLSECKEVKTTNRKGNEVDVGYRVNLVKTISYTLHMNEQRPNRIAWSFVKGEYMKDNHGTWLLEAAGEGKTKATYTIEVAVGLLVPKMIINSLVDAGLPKMLDSFKARAESR